MFLRRLAVEGSHLTRLLIASARELIADAESVRLTQNPAALVSALGRIEGRSVIPGLAAGQDAMMIDGAHEGAFATHPTIAERVAAIVSVTGSMALIAPARRDTRPAACAGDGFGRRSAVEPEYLRSARQGVNAALARVSSGNEFNRLGLTREMSVGAVAAVGVFLWVHSADLRNPAALVEAFDPAPMRTLLALGREQAQCQMQGMGGLIRGAAKPLDCSELFKTLGEHSGDDGLIGKIARSMTEAPEGMYVERPGTFTNVPPPMVQLAEVQRGRCFRTEGYAVGDRGLHAVTEQPREHDDISLSPATWLGATTPRAAWARLPPPGATRLLSTISNPARRWAKSFIASSAIPACKSQPHATPLPSTKRRLQCCASGSATPASHRR
jgi:hypothetical protein